MSCERCRERHTKCDDRQPRCSRCEKAGRQCKRTSKRSLRVAVRPTGFAVHQTWVPVPPRVDFVDESAALVSSETSWRDCETGRPEREHAESVTSTGTAAGISLRSPASAAAQNDENANLFGVSDEAFQQQVQSPFATRQGADLMRYFVDHCACFFDFSDSRRHFACDVPQRARRNGMLANAMLALAARHRSRTRHYDSYISDRYYHECLQALIPRLGDFAAIKDDELLAAVVILRLLEEMDVSIVGSDPQGHLMGTQAIITASQIQSPSPVTSLRKACYWGAFRQEIFMSLTFQRPFKLRLPNLAPSVSSADDWEWSLKATYLCGKVQEFVFGDDVANADEYHRLTREVGAWKMERPTGFDPMYQDSCEEAGSFPEIRLHMDCHVMGWQYISMAHLLLIVHQPLPRVGPRHKEALQRMEEAAIAEVKTICGVAMSNSQTAPAQLVACMAITLFGDRFVSRSEQALLREMLIRTEKSTGWPTLSAQQQLERCWHWDMRTSSSSIREPSSV
ncbi:hypothetical protein H2204_004940 [Knufia peltigerae]|uniref:Zn(2)-C6 fungal-type domain-containing protein n=1 Tax=Knufia peltigerae TaxID=1002370 RepID=A0AA38Y6Q1_9EURO|nr:hypothetical protein H2204_004940 [Knufia peltigerae]